MRFLGCGVATFLVVGLLACSGGDVTVLETASPSGAGGTTASGTETSTPAPLCDPASSDRQTDAASCGTCGHACGGKESCVAGTCQASPPVVSFALSTIYDESVAKPDRHLLVNIGDLNEDGHLDLLRGDLGSPGAGALSVMLGRGDGTFEPPITLDVSVFPSPLLLADLDKDGHLDLLTADPSSIPSASTTTLMVLWGTGQATFGDASSFPLGRVSNASFMSDVNGDGRLDIHAVAASSDTSSVLINQGGRGFVTQSIPFACPAFDAITTGDLNADGTQDMVIASSSGGSTITQVWLGQADGSFGDGKPVAGLGGTRAAPEGLVLVHDLDGNHHDDLILANKTYNSMDVALTGSNSQSIPPSTALPIGVRASSMAVADVSGDGNADVVIHDPTVALAGVMLGKADGSFAFGPFVSVSLAAGGDILSGDFNEDGKIDLLFSSSVTSQMFLLLNTTAS